MNDRKFIKGLKNYYNLLHGYILHGCKSYMDLSSNERLILSKELFSNLDGIELILANSETSKMEDAIKKYMNPQPTNEDKQMLGSEIMLLVLEATKDLIEEDIDSIIEDLNIDPLLGDR